MIPAVQLDPASLTLWYSPEIISQSPHRELLADSVWRAMRGDMVGVLESVEQGKQEGCGVRCAHLASAVWHEQRHFLDLILTNQGAFRVRQFLSLYANLEQLLAEAQRSGETLICPITVYADPVRAAAHGVEAPPESVLGRVAKDVRQRSRMIAEDRATVTLPFGTIEFGGEAQLEALAYFNQFVALDHYVGRELSLAVQEDLPGGSVGLRYRWAANLGAALGLGRVRQLGDQLVELDVTRISAIMYGSLASRRWGQEQTHHSGGSSSGFPGARLAGFIEEFRGSGETDAPADEHWHAVNEAAERLWGRSAIDEMLVDYKLEETWVQTITESEGTPGSIRDVVLDFHALRGALLQVLQDDPIAVLDPLGYATALLPRVRPIPIVATPSGMAPPLGSDLTQVFGYDGGSPDGEDTWIWATTPNDWDDPGQASLIAKARPQWLNMVSYFAPLAKLLMNGRRHRTMLGPELAMAMAQLDSAGIEFRVDPLFDAPREPADAALLFHLNGQQRAVCDYCHADIEAPGGHLLSPWVFRRNTAIADHIKQALGGGTRGDRRFRRDWSAWLVCEDCNGFFTRLGVVPAA